MFIRPCFRKVKGKRQAYWALVESYRTARGPRQRTVAWLGRLKESERAGVQRAAEGSEKSPYTQLQLFDHEGKPEPEWVEVDAANVRVENQLEFGGAWLALELIHRLRLDELFENVLPRGKEDIAWAKIATILVICRLCRPSSELHIAEHYYQSTALPDLLGVPAAKVNHQRLYRALDQLLPHKEALESHLKNRLGTLFALDYDLLLYDVTSTYFEGLCEGNPQAQRGYSRDKRSDCKQVCIGLVVSRDGMPIGYEVFAGNRNDVTTWQEIVTTMEARYGRAEPHLVRRPRDDEPGEHRVHGVGRSALYHRRVEGDAQEVRARVARRRLADDPRRSGSEDVPVARRRQGDVHLVPQSRSPRKGKSDARAVRASDRRGVGKGPRKLREAEVEEGSDRPPRGQDHGQEFPGRRALRSERSKKSMAGPSSPGRRTRRGASGRRSTRAVICSAPTSPTGRPRTCGKRTSN